MQFIDLERHFRDLNEKELEDPELLASLNDWRYAAPAGWNELLCHRRVLLIAEAGSGKTRELQAQAERLSTAGKPAFFLALESLDRVSLTDLLDPNARQRFEAWRRTEAEAAWFFLDAVDELKLTKGKLERALALFEKAVSGRLSDIHVVLSCRPYDWRTEIDMEIFTNRLPVPARQRKPKDAETAFLGPLTKEGKEDIKSEEKQDTDDHAVKTVILLPLSNTQIEIFITHLGVTDPKALITEIEARDAWSFARRPLDLTELVTNWKTRGRLGTRAEQHEQNIVTKLTDNPNCPDIGVLNDAKARLGAERLALALALTRTRTIRAPDLGTSIPNNTGVLDPRAILHDWTEEERQTLLRRALFDPATYGRVRFHHRSVQEYLAAQNLKRLRQAGMSTKALHRLLFAERYGEKLVLPSMQAISAWLALDDETVRQTLIAREPETLLTQGDPESLQISDRVKIIASFADNYGSGGWRGLRIPTEEVRRIAHPLLADAIRALWPSCHTQLDVGSLLIDLIWKGRIESLTDLVRSKARHKSADDHHRAMAVRALLACNATAAVREIVSDLLSQPDNWKPAAVHGLVTDLFPHFLTVDELLSLLKHVPELQRTVGGFSWHLRLIAERLDPTSDIACQLRDQLADLIWAGRNPRQEYHRILGRYNFLSPALGTICLGQLRLGTAPDAALIRASVIASRFQPEDGVSNSEITPRLREAAASHCGSRALFFWTELDLMGALVPADTPGTRLFYVQHDGFVTHFIESDWSWLLARLVDNAAPDLRPLALQALLELWHRLGRPQDKVEVLRNSVAVDAAMRTLVENVTGPIVRNPEIEEHQRKHQEYLQKHAAQEEQRVANWKKWRAEMLADPSGAFSTEHTDCTLDNLYRWLMQLPGTGTRYNVWDSEKIVDAFGEDISQRAQLALRLYWRKSAPPLWSEREESKKGTIYYSWMIGLCGVAIEAQTPGWGTALTTPEAELATTYGTIEINGLPPFVSDLTKTHPTAVKAVLAPELTRQLKEAGAHGHLPLLQDIGHADDSVKRLVVDVLTAALPDWPEPTSPQAAGPLAIHLETVLRIVAEVGTPTARTTAADNCAMRYTAAPEGSNSQVWLRGLLRLDPLKASELLLATLDSYKNGDQRGINLLAKLLGERDSLALAIEDVTKRAQLLGTLVRAAYRLVRPNQDEEHDGMFEANTRDQAERARELLLSLLLNTPGQAAQTEMRAIANEPDFVHFPDRLRLLARQRAAQDAEFEAFSPEAVSQLETRYEAPPRDRDGLFTLMMDRLGDLQYELAHGDFSDRAVLEAIDDEERMQQTLALRLKKDANGAYQISRESEVIDRKRTDLHFAVVNGPAKGVIEIKLAEKWTLLQLEDAVRTQLVGQYLRDRDRKAGILLLTYAGRKQSWQCHATGTNLGFEELVAHLKAVALATETEMAGAIKIGVYALELRPAR